MVTRHDTSRHSLRRRGSTQRERDTTVAEHNYVARSLVQTAKAIALGIQNKSAKAVQFIAPEMPCARVAARWEGSKLSPRNAPKALMSPRDVPSAPSSAEAATKNAAARALRARSTLRSHNRRSQRPVPSTAPSANISHSPRIEVPTMAASISRSTSSG